MNSIQKFFDLIVVHDCKFEKVRVGNINDGGYIVADEFAKNVPTCYCFGIGDDLHFELDFHKRYGSKMLLYDPYIDFLIFPHNDFEFYKRGMGRKGDSSIVPVQNAFLKMDIEWCEWNAIWQLNISGWLNRFSQMVIEFHIVHSIPPKGLTPYFTKFYKDVYAELNDKLFMWYALLMEYLTKHFYIYHIHANNSLPKVEVGGVKFPPLIELSFIRKDIIKTNPVLETCTFPVVGLDMPNKTDRSDIVDYYPFGANYAD